MINWQRNINDIFKQIQRLPTGGRRRRASRTPYRFETAIKPLPTFTNLPTTATIPPATTTQQSNIAVSPATATAQPTATPMAAPATPTTSTTPPTPMSVGEIFEDPVGRMIAQLTQQFAQTYGGGSQWAQQIGNLAQQYAQQMMEGTPQRQMMEQIAQQYAQQMTQRPFTTEQEQAILAQQDRAVEQRYAQARQDLLNRLAALGIPPTSGQAQAMLQQLAQQEAAEKAGFRRQLAMQEIQEIVQRPQLALQALAGVQQLRGTEPLQALQALTQAQQMAMLEPTQALQQLMNLEQLRQARIQQMAGWVGAPPSEAAMQQMAAAQITGAQAPAALAQQQLAQLLQMLSGLGQMYTGYMSQQQMLPLYLLMVRMAMQPYQIPQIQGIGGVAPMMPAGEETPMGGGVPQEVISQFMQNIFPLGG